LIEASRLEIREKVKLKLKQVIADEEFRALKKNHILLKAPEESAEEMFNKEIALKESQAAEEIAKLAAENSAVNKSIEVFKGLAVAANTYSKLRDSQPSNE
jgi:hypothetical protein